MGSFSNPDEIFDVVDEQDHMVGQAPRREVHARGLRHRAVHVLVHDEAGRIFLQRRSRLKDTFPDCWDSSCSGHVDSGESYVGAARRELFEELGWRNDQLPLRPVLKLGATAETGWEFIEVFLLGPTTGPFILNPEEITEGRWISPADLQAELQSSPTGFAGVVRLLWTTHADRIITLLPSPKSPNF